MAAQAEDGRHDSTLCAQAGARKAIWQASVYDFHSLTQLQSAAHIYRRYGCPNSDELASAVAALERAPAGLATSTGMGAIVAAVMSICKAGDLAIVNSDVYGVTYQFFNVDLRRFGIDIMFEDAFDVHLLENVLKEASEPINGPSKRNVVVFVESITNPLVKVADVSSIAIICKKYAATLIVDNTMATPLRMKPLLEGANLVVHSATKFMGGHSDLMAGIVVGASRYVEEATNLATRWGLTAAPFDAWLAVRGIHSLQVRMERAWASAAALAERCVASELALRIMSAPKCAIMCMEVHGGLEGANRAIEAFKLLKLSPSFGGTSTIVSHSATSSHKSLGAELRNKLGITDGLLRVSVGLEEVDDIWADLRAGLLAAAADCQESRCCASLPDISTSHHSTESE